jgi:hypothetical protein
MTVGWAFFSFWPITMFPVLEGPQWKRGFIANVVLTVAFWALFMLGQFLWKRDQKRGLYELRDEEEDDFKAAMDKEESTHVEMAEKKD